MSQIDTAHVENQGHNHETHDENSMTGILASQQHSFECPQAVQ